MLAKKRLCEAETRYLHGETFFRDGETFLQGEEKFLRGAGLCPTNRRMRSAQLLGAVYGAVKKLEYGDSPPCITARRGITLASNFLHSSYQKRSFSANWICRERAEPVVLITPAVGSGLSTLVAPAKTWRATSFMAKLG